MSKTSHQSDITPSTKKSISTKTPPINPNQITLRILLKSLKNFSNEELEKVTERVGSIVKRREKSQRKADLLKVQELIQKHDFDLNEIQ